MPATVSTFAVFAALLSTTIAQTASDTNYSINPEPPLQPLATASIDLTFPDCDNGPLSKDLVCNSSANAYDRAASLVSLLTFDELVNNTGNTGGGAPRLGLPRYQVWYESLHGLFHANFTPSGDWSWATSFPMPILTSSALNRTLINQIATIISTQGRAFNNVGRFGLDTYSPNINTFRHPVWGRGQETAGEDAFCLASAFAYEYITGIQGGMDPDHVKLIATAKHYGGYDIENWDDHSRLGNDMIITQQDLSEYYMPQFLVASRDAKVRSVMCSYNAVNGVPSCSNSFFLQTILRDTFNFVEHGYVSGDCGAVGNVFNPHMYAENYTAAAADSIRAGTDIDCGTTYQYYFNESFDEGMVARKDLERGVRRLYTNLIQSGYFDGKNSEYRDLTWDDVLSTDAWNIAYEAAVEGIILLKNDGTLPLSDSTRSVALIGGWANATFQMQGNYYGIAPYLTSPLDAFQASDFETNYALGTNITSNSTEGFADALETARKSDVIIFAGGIDNSLEAEALDRMNITWPGNQLDLIDQLSQLGKPLIVLQMGGGQVDSSSLKSNKNVGSLVWGGYPGQSGGSALLDIITGKRAPAGRLVTTQYPAEYATSFPATDMNLRPNGSNPGQTYMWYTGTPVYEFGHGLFYTTFNASQSDQSSIDKSYDINDLLSKPHPGNERVEQRPFLDFTAEITNTGQTPSDYTAMLFANTTAGPEPYPNKWLVGFDRLSTLSPGSSKTMTFPVTIDSLARTDELGNRVLYPGKYELALNNEQSVVVAFSLTGEEKTIAKWPLDQQQIPPA